MRDERRVYSDPVRANSTKPLVRRLHSLSEPIFPPFNVLIECLKHLILVLLDDIDELL